MLVASSARVSVAPCASSLKLRWGRGALRKGQLEQPSLVVREYFLGGLFVGVDDRAVALRSPPTGLLGKPRLRLLAQILDTPDPIQRLVEVLAVFTDSPITGRALSALWPLFASLILCHSSSR